MLSFSGIRLYLLCVVAFIATSAGWTWSAEHRPNFVLILCDNLGYGDIGCFGSQLHRTPHIDRLALEGMRWTSFYSTSGVCTPSRASLMSGCYPRRVGLHRTEPDGSVLSPVSPNGLHPDEKTIAEVLHEQGYATACIGKWHLGDQPVFLPTRQGFDYYFGIPYSDDMTRRADNSCPPLPLMRNEQVVEAPANRHTLTKRYTEEVIRFMEQHQQKPFFVYLPHAMPGSTRRPFASQDFQGQSNNGPYGDSVEEIDWSTGQILDALRRLELDDQTLVVWTSDNGAPQRQPPQGSNRPLEGWGYTASEGGMRVPCVARWPGHIPAGTNCDEISTTMDLLPTFVRLAGATVPQGRKIDGHDIWPLLSGQPGARTPYDAFYYYHVDQLWAVRQGPWKLYLRDHTSSPAARLVDLDEDIGEKRDVAEEHPEIVTRLVGLAEQARRELGDGDRIGAGQRPAGRVDNPQPLRLP